MIANFYRLMLVTNKGSTPLNEYLKFIEICANSGITSVQLREKNYTYQENLIFGRELQKILKPFNIPLIINDNLKLALDLGANGVHLGQTDGDVLLARKLLGEEKIIGVSVSSIEELLRCHLLPITYIGCGAIYPTKNKVDAKHVGLEGLKKIAKLSKCRIVAIGGIDELNFEEVLKTAAVGVAGIGLFHNSQDIVTTIKTLHNAIFNIMLK